MLDLKNIILNEDEEKDLDYIFDEEENIEEDENDIDEEIDENEKIK